MATKVAIHYIMFIQQPHIFLKSEASLPSRPNGTGTVTYCNIIHDSKYVRL